MMCIDRMDFAGGDRLFVAGPSYGPQPRPMPPSEFSFEDTFQHNDLTTAGWTTTADTVEFVNGDLLIISGGAEVKLSRAVPTGPFDLSINVRLDDIPAEGPSLTFGCGTSASVRQFSDAWHLDLGNNAAAAGAILAIAVSPIQNAQRRAADHRLSRRNGDRISSPDAMLRSPRDRRQARHRGA